MKEIKFRAWDTYDKMMLEGLPRVCCPVKASHSHPGYSISDIDDFNGRFILLQYIDRKDKNGKEIYKGDIVKGFFNADEVDDWIYLGLTGQERLRGEKIFIVDSIHFGYEYPVPTTLEVLGNIYENPELLKETK